MMQQASSSSERGVRKFWLVVFGVHVASILLFREWLPLPEAARFWGMLAAGALLFLVGPFILLILTISAAMRLWARDLRSAAFRLFLPVATLLVFFAIPERKLVETVLHFREAPQRFKGRVYDVPYSEMSGPYTGWLIVYSRSDDPESFSGDTVHGGYCAERGSVRWQLEPHWYVCRADVDFP